MPKHTMIYTQRKVILLLNDRTQAKIKRPIDDGKSKGETAVKSEVTGQLIQKPAVLAILTICAK